MAPKAIIGSRSESGHPVFTRERAKSGHELGKKDGAFTGAIHMPQGTSAWVIAP
jgi:hypothetical protein